jgi:hypothetical protein
MRIGQSYIRSLANSLATILPPPLLTELLNGRLTFTGQLPLVACQADGASGRNMTKLNLRSARWLDITARRACPESYLAIHQRTGRMITTMSRYEQEFL